MQRCTASAAGGTIQRVKPGPATVAALEKNAGPREPVPWSMLLIVVSVLLSEGLVRAGRLELCRLDRSRPEKRPARVDVNELPICPERPYSWTKHLDSRNIENQSSVGNMKCVHISAYTERKSTEMGLGRRPELAARSSTKTWHECACRRRSASPFAASAIYFFLPTLKFFCLMSTF